MIISQNSSSRFLIARNKNELNFFIFPLAFKSLLKNDIAENNKRKMKWWISLLARQNRRWNLFFIEILLVEMEENLQIGNSIRLSSE